MYVIDTEELTHLVESAVNSIDVDFVSLCFEAFREENDILFPICPPVYSEPIGNAKSAKTGKLKISRINKCSGSCYGGEEIWLLVEKINKKGLVVRFWEECNNGKIIWESSLEGDDLILHHQYAIIFKTPVYKDVNISSEVEVYMRLERTTQPNQPCDYSEPITFVYEPAKMKLSKDDNLCRKESILTPLKSAHVKRPRTDSSSLNNNYQGKCKMDDIEFENMNFEEEEGGGEGEEEEDGTESYIEQILFNEKDLNEFDQAWAKFNVEEFLQFISSDDVDMPFQRDGISAGNPRHRQNLLYKLYLLYTKLDESDVKKLTEDVSNFRLSKKETMAATMAATTTTTTEQVKDAASTLLSLRSRALANKYSSPSVVGKICEKNNSQDGDDDGDDDHDVVNIPEGNGNDLNSKSSAATMRNSGTKLRTSKRKDGNLKFSDNGNDKKSTRDCKNKNMDDKNEEMIVNLIDAKENGGHFTESFRVYIRSHKGEGIDSQFLPYFKFSR
ncbi:hypothetical protein Phum_PHUM424590 [Pediculus humanus corporis]|uniref:RHD domain-containing protein n=1 Tax=Pediculus humanus subsp. corporis TaxID=121224 RepID=E0VSZ6_PEDHC|nr:uncharacterized protein Phum_PHUM424590 [Pediculus humanus corporis]EEB16502.1 hypothetical protein Phum_PHUM424590 [Pediculus humanus corporis]